jgi:hypothetical protein
MRVPGLRSVFIVVARPGEVAFATMRCKAYMARPADLTPSDALDLERLALGFEPPLRSRR